MKIISRLIPAEINTYLKLEKARRDPNSFDYIPYLNNSVIYFYTISSNDICNTNFNFYVAKKDNKYLDHVPFFSTIEDALSYSKIIPDQSPKISLKFNYGSIFFNKISFTSYNACLDPYKHNNLFFSKQVINSIVEKEFSFYNLIFTDYVFKYNNFFKEKPFVNTPINLENISLTDLVKIYSEHYNQYLFFNDQIIDSFKIYESQIIDNAYIKIFTRICNSLATYLFVMAFHFRHISRNDFTKLTQIVINPGSRDDKFDFNSSETFDVCDLLNRKIVFKCYISYDEKLIMIDSIEYSNDNMLFNNNFGKKNS